MASWAIVDVETTGLHPVKDRVVEVAVIRMDPSGLLIDEWATLVNPGVRVAATRLHGLDQTMLEDAPRFHEVAEELLWRLAGSVIVAHNAPFDSAFLQAETVRAGIAWGPIEGFCTMATALQLGLTKQRRLDLCCRELGVVISHDHAALEDARGVRAILERLIPRAWSLSLPSSAPTWIAPSRPSRIKPRPAMPAEEASVSGLGAIAGRVVVPSVPGVPAVAATTYLGLLDVVLEDRVVTDQEVDALAMFANACGIGRSGARDLHRSYLESMWELARADGEVTDDETADLERLMLLLSVPLSRIGA